MNLFKELYQYRELLKSNVKKEIRGKYKGSLLGVLWSFISPLLMVMVYSFVFDVIVKINIENYSVYLITGILPWIFFSGCVASGTITVIINANLIKKVYFPREILPISVVLSGLINFLISCIVIAIFLIVSGIGFSSNIIYFPLIVFVQFLLCLGVTFILSGINVYIRDTEYIMNFLILLLMYLTPILWEIKDAPDTLKNYIYLNPLTGIIDSYRKIFYYKMKPDFNILFITGVASLILCVVGYFIYRKLERGFAEEL